MHIGHLIANRRTENSQNLARWIPREKELRSDLENLRRGLVTNAHDPYTVQQLRKRIDQAETDLAELTPKIAAIKDFKYPTPQQVDRLSGLLTKANGEQMCMAYADSEAKTAERQERPQAAADARKRKDKHEAEFVKANRELRGALEKFGFDPTPLCGRT